MVPIEERSSRYTNRQHHIANVVTQSPQSARREQLESSVVRSHQVLNEQEEEVSRRSSGTGQNFDMSIDDEGKPNVSVQSRKNP